MHDQPFHRPLALDKTQPEIWNHRTFISGSPLDIKLVVHSERRFMIQHLVLFA